MHRIVPSPYRGGLIGYFSKPAVITKSTWSATIGTARPRPKSLRLIVAVPWKPRVVFFDIGFTAEPVKLAWIVAGLVTPWIVRMPMISALLPLTDTPVDSKCAVGNLAASKNIGAWNSASSAAIVECIVLIGTSTDSFVAAGDLGSIVRLPVAPDSKPMLWVRPK